MKYYIIAGEASGDLHGSNLMKYLKIADPEFDARFWGGDLMNAQGGYQLKHIKELAFMGFREVLLNIRTIKKNFKLCFKDILSYSPDVLILIDYPGFNLRVAEFAYNNNIRVAYYISPQIWAWKQSRIKKIKRFVNKMFVILPFEKDFYERFDFPVEYVGHPLLDPINEKLANAVDRDVFLKENNLTDKKIIALLPGSRKQEIQKKLPVMVGITEKFKDKYQFVVAGAPSIEMDFYTNFLTGKNIRILYNKTYDLLTHSYAAMVTSGTATLETALFGVPEVVCYKSGALSYHIAKRLIKVKYISLVNLIMDKMVVKELIQNDLTENKLAQELERLLHDDEYRAGMINDFKNLKEVLGGSGASERTAASIVKYLTR